MRTSRSLSMMLTGAELAAVAALVYVADVESSTFRSVFVLAIIGSVVNAALPGRHRLAFFAALSLASVFQVLGVSASVVVGSGATLLAICWLRARLSVRIGILLAAGALLAGVRSGAIPTNVPAAVWVTLASMMMFRLGFYLAAVQRGEATAGVAGAVAYAFMLPSACFPLFPIIDHRTFLQSREQDVSAAAFERGVVWITRGLLHLLAYRLVYADIAPRELLVYGLGDVIRFVLSSVLLYLKVSGHFHVITGVLHLYGFALPTTHRWYLLSTGFADYWRRINTYVRAFLLRAVYYPVFLRLRHKGIAFRAVGATIAVFGASWLLHAYQYFWINGRILWSVQDVTFWGTFAILVSAATARALRRRAPTFTPGWDLRRGWSTLITFSTISILWTWWSSSSVDAWLLMWGMTRHASPADWVLLGLVAASILLLGASGVASRAELRQESTAGRRLARLAFLGGTCFLMLPVGQRLLPGRLQQYAQHARGYGVLAQHELARVRGYYEDVTRTSSEPVESPGDAGDTPDLYVQRSDFLFDQLRPGVSGRLLGRAFRTSSAGIRDREYEREKPAGVFRIALIGPSDAMGAGVGDAEVFEAITEANLDSIARRANRAVEIMNFSFNAWSLPQRSYAISALAGAWAPDLVLIVVNPYEMFLMQFTVSRLLERGIAPPDLTLASLIDSADVSADMNPAAMVTALRPFEERIHRRSLAWAKEEAGRAGARLALVTVSFPGVSWTGGLTMLRRVAGAVDVPVLECAGVWRWANGGTYALSGIDAHPNAAGHRRLAACLSSELLRSTLIAEALRAASPEPGSGGPESRP